MPQEFPRATPAEMLGQTISMFGAPQVSSAGLAPAVTERLLTLRERADGFYRQQPTWEERHEANMERQKAEQRLAQLVAHPHEGGFALNPETDVRVIAQRNLVAELTVTAKRLDERYARTTAVSQAALRICTNVETWLRDKPPNTIIEDAPEPKVALQKGESLLDAIEHLRRRTRELRADLHRAELAPMPSSHAKQRMRAQVEALAQAPNVSMLIEHADGKILWPMANLRSQVHNVQAPAVARGARCAPRTARMDVQGCTDNCAGARDRRGGR